MSALLQSLKVIVVVIVLGILFAILPFELSMPTELYNILTGGYLQSIFKSITFFIPVNFIITCIIFIYGAKYFMVFFRFISWVYHKII